MSAALPVLLRPWWLLTLLPIAFLIWRLRRASAAGETAWRKVIDAHLLPHLLVRGAPRTRRFGLIAVTAGALLAVLALAGPGLSSQPQAAYRSAALRVLVVDLSADMAPYLEQVKPKILHLLHALPDGQTALLVYAGEPYLVVPPTSDVETIALFVPELETGIVPVPGNRPDEAMRMAAMVLERNSHRAGGALDIVWISAASDAANQSKIDAAAPAGVRLSLLLAAPSEAPGTNGMALRLHGDNRDIDALVARLAGERGWMEDRDRANRGTADAGYWLVLALLPLAALAFRRGVLALVAGAALLGAGMPQPARANGPAPIADYHAWQLFRRGEFEAAAARFSDPRWRAAAYYRAGRYDEAARLLEGARDPDALYNRGNALARQGLLAQALDSYEASLALRPRDPDTVHNRDLVRDLLNRHSGGAQGSGRSGDRTAPPPPASGNGEREAGALAEQWLRGVPDDPGSLLRRKLLSEHRRRRAGEAERAW
ncbi:tetratricopeptide repeat protein [Noviherbaspirillum sp. UKPF54]|uniref:vWA domain-containing protein n=1 Tax=Noviherbaspirillum sp. UKPF54 TaxID=2601898 RepID=UPI0011B1BF73|nr:tetratricopeptide repeat protein [Noviherbaspirillum sp. UKPF54]QDZ27155.1 VWA domain-containing protein [Noviherbaspirillum sp. UKPF54]